MKQFIIWIFLLLAYIPVKAQYQSILNDSNRTWFVYNTNTWHFVEDKIDSLYLGNWVQLPTGRYRELLVKAPAFIWPPGRAVGLLREDTVIGKAWYLDTLNSPFEYEIYDLSLNQGDTIRPTNWRSLVVDTVYFQNNRKHIRLIIIKGQPFNIQFNTHLLYDTYDTIMYIEGVGSSKGFNDLSDTYYFWYYSNRSDYLVCSYQGGTQLFKTSFPSNYPIKSCDSLQNGTFTSLKEGIANEVLIYPNPSKGIYTIEHDAEIVSYEVYSVEGKLLIRNNVQDLKQINLNLTNQEDGIYFLNLETKQGKIYYKKLVKQ